MIDVSNCRLVDALPPPLDADCEMIYKVPSLKWQIYSFDNMQ